MPAMHGPFGEDGQIQAFLEENNIPFIGSSSESCKMAFDKYNANKILQEKRIFHVAFRFIENLFKRQRENNERIF